MADPLTYNQRLMLGAIRVRRDFADQARKSAIAAALLNDYRACEALHAEADQHEAAIIAAAQQLGSSAQSPLPRISRKLAQVPASETVSARPEAAAARVTWRGARENTIALARPLAWQET
jgi:hypothetical protein